MNLSSNRHRLIEEALAPASLEISLAATRRAARGRRVRRRVVRAAAAGCVVLAGAWLFRMGPGPGRTMDATASREDPPPFVLVTNGPSPSTIVVHTATAPPGLMVTTHAAPVSIPSATREDVFISAGERPGGLLHLADGSARWMWLDLPELE